MEILVILRTLQIISRKCGIDFIKKISSQLYELSSYKCTQFTARSPLIIFGIFNALARLVFTGLFKKYSFLFNLLEADLKISREKMYDVDYAVYNCVASR